MNKKNIKLGIIKLLSIIIIDLFIGFGAFIIYDTNTTTGFIAGVVFIFIGNMIITELLPIIDKGRRE